MLLDNLPVMVCRLDDNGVFLESRGAALRRIGQEDNEVVGRNLGLEWPECRSLLEKVLAGESAHFEYEYGQGGRKRVHEMWFMPNPADGGAIGFGVDITERKRAEDELSRSEAFNRRVVESSRDGIMVLDPAGTLLSISQGGRKLMEMDEPEIFLDRSWLDFWRGDDRAKAENALRTASSRRRRKVPGLLPQPYGQAQMVGGFADAHPEPGLGKRMPARHLPGHHRIQALRRIPAPIQGAVGSHPARHFRCGGGGRRRRARGVRQRRRGAHARHAVVPGDPRRVPGGSGIEPGGAR